MARDLYSMVRRFLFALPPEMAHQLTLTTLKYLHNCHALPKPTLNASPVRLAGLTFPNRVGLAAGLDKNGDFFQALHRLGFGFLELGTVTPVAQPGNPKPRLFRLPKNQSLINRLGFNNKGIDYLISQLANVQKNLIIGINIGKNKATPNESAIRDYSIGMTRAYPHASYIAVNISSPNTPDLRELQYGSYLSELLSHLKEQQIKLKQQYQRYVPLFVKIAPDSSEHAVFDICHTLAYYECDGVIVSNSTVSRDGLIQEPSIGEMGGLSGAKVTVLANQTLQWVRQHLPKPFPVIAVGGIMTAADALKKCELGADLIQLYTGLIYSGPQLVKTCIQATEDYFLTTQ